jgi:hypothetical protein
MADDTYLFIDGEYHLRGKAPRGSNPCVFFYDSIDETPRPGEAEEACCIRLVPLQNFNFESTLLKALDDLGGELEQMRRRKDELEREVANLAQAVAQGDFSPALRAALVTREREISDITAKLLESRPDSLRVKLRNSA